MVEGLRFLSDEICEAIQWKTSRNFKYKDVFCQFWGKSRTIFPIVIWSLWQKLWDRDLACIKYPSCYKDEAYSNCNNGRYFSFFENCKNFFEIQIKPGTENEKEKQETDVVSSGCPTK